MISVISEGSCDD